LHLQTQERERHEHVALDGKTLRGTLAHEATDQQPMHQLSLYETGSGVLLKEQIVGEKQNERSLLGEFLTPRWLTGRLISADAMFTYASFCLQVIQAGGASVLIAKANHPTLQEDLRLFFAEPPADCRDWRLAVSWHKGHGRLERRELVASTGLNEFLAKQWPGVAQVFRLTRTIQHKGHTRHEVVYGLTSRSPAQSTAAHLLDAVRGHWSIENRLHWRRDVSLGEDHCQVRKGVAPRLLAVLNSFLLGLLDFFEVRSLPPLMRLLDAHPLLALRLLLKSVLTFT
jgi:predicted transposase YbfD/YdcC